MTRAARVPAVLALLAALGAAAATGADPAKPAAPAASETIRMHVGIPGALFLGEPMTEVLARFPDAKRLPFANQAQVIRVQIPSEGISALAMGDSPASMTIESIGFNFAEPYEGIPAGTRRTAEGIGAGSNVNELLETYGKPAESSPEDRRGLLAPKPQGGAAPGRTRHLYRNADGSVTTYFVTEGSRVLRMAMSRPAMIERYIVKPPAAAPPHAGP